MYVKRTVVRLIDKGTVFYYDGNKYIKGELHPFFGLPSSKEVYKGLCCNSGMIYCFTSDCEVSIEIDCKEG